MVNWGAIIEAPIAVLLLYVAVAMIQPLQIPLFGLLSNSTAFPHGATTMVMIQLITLVLAVLIIYSIYRSFKEPEQPSFVPIR